MPSPLERKPGDRGSVERDQTPRHLGPVRSAALSPEEDAELKEIIARKKQELMASWFAEERLRERGLVPPLERQGQFRDMQSSFERIATRAVVGRWLDFGNPLRPGEVFLENVPQTGFRERQQAMRQSEGGAILTRELFESAREAVTISSGAGTATLTGLPVRGSVVAVLVDVATAPTGATDVRLYLFNRSGATQSNPENVVDAYTVAFASAGVVPGNMFTGEDAPYINKDDDRASTAGEPFQKRRQLYARIVETGASVAGAYGIRVLAVERA